MSTTRLAAIVLAVAILACGCGRKSSEPDFKGKSYSAWVTQLKSADRDEDRLEALDAINHIHPADPEPRKELSRLVVPYLAHDDDRFRSRADYLLRNLQPDSRVVGPQLSDLLKSGKQTHSVLSVVEAFGPDGARPAVPGLAAVVGSDDATDAATATKLLGDIGPDAAAAVPALKAALAHPHAARNFRAAVALARINKAPEAAPMLVEVAKAHRNTQVRGSLFDDADIELAKRTLKDTYPDAARAAGLR
jgi:hypothetical protein